ncbi:MAG: hypothetical protein ABGX78_00095 [Microbacterium sp.]|jgi:hypothetical protein|uniref:hypothetical protein n=1 Tax=Microbacterium TaxID=33882 RepID=UPI00311DA321|tara:strand:+ start:351 stop:989 length:639 start_codon:yes stop_codon:yes gene_type:complete
MRSVHELSGEPWPHDMVISVDQPNNLLTLLFVRDVWDIARDMDIPALAPPPTPGNSMRPESPSPDVWSERWVETWHAAWAWYVDGGGIQYRDAARIDPQAALADLAAHLPPMWETQYGSEGIDRDALWQWMQTLHDLPRPLDEAPERRGLSDLIGAWRDGIESIIVLPYGIDFSRRITSQHLVVSSMTRDDPALYGQALRRAVGAPPSVSAP